MTQVATLEVEKLNIAGGFVGNLKKFKESIEGKIDEKKYKNLEYFIDTAIKEDKVKNDEKELIIEFSQDELDTFLTQEIKEQEKILRRKIEKKNEVTQNAQKKETLLAKLVDTTKITENTKAKLKNFLGFSVLTAPFLLLGEQVKNIFSWLREAPGKVLTGAKKVWYKLASIWPFGGKEWGDKKLAELEKEEIKQKMGKEKEKGKEILADIGAPLAILGTSALGTIAAIKKILPGSIQNSLEGFSGKGLITKILQHKALRYFGIGGIAFGIARLYTYIEENKAFLGEAPTTNDEASKKGWWENALSQAGISVSEGANDILALVTGETLGSKLEQNELKEGYVFLKDHPKIQSLQNNFIAWEASMEEKLRDKKYFIGLAGFLAAKKIPGLIIGGGKISLNGLSTGTTLMRIIGAKGIAGLGLMFGVGFAVGANGMAGLAHVQVPEDMNDETEIKDFLTSICNMPESKTHMMGIIPEDKLEVGITEASKFLAQPNNKIKELWGEFEKKFLEDLPQSIRDLITIDEQESILRRNKDGLEKMRTSLIQKKAKNENGEQYEPLTSTLEIVCKKLGDHIPLTEGDVFELMEKTRGTDIRIILADDDGQNLRLQWAQIDTFGMPLQGVIHNLCVNPKLPFYQQVIVARDFYENELTDGVITTGVNHGMRDVIDLVNDIVRGGIPDTGGILEAGGNLIGIGNDLFLEYFGQKFLLGPINILRSLIPYSMGGISFQEGVASWGDAMAPFVVYGSAKGLKTLMTGGLNRGTLQGLGSIIVHSATAIVEGAYKTYKFPSKIFETWKSGHLQTVLQNPKYILSEGGARLLNRIPLIRISPLYKNIITKKYVSDLIKIFDDLAGNNITSDIYSSLGKYTKLDEYKIKKAESLLAYLEKNNLDIFTRIADKLNISHPGDLLKLTQDSRKETLKKLVQYRGGIESEILVDHRINTNKHATHLTEEISKIDSHNAGTKSLKMRTIKGGKIVGALAGIGIMSTLIDDATGAYHGKVGDAMADFEEGEYSSESVNFYGFEKNSQKSSQEITEENHEENNLICATPEEFNQKIAKIEASYLPKFDPITQRETAIKLRGGMIGSALGTRTEGLDIVIDSLKKHHRNAVSHVKKLIKANKKMMEQYWGEAKNETILPQTIQDKFAANKVAALMFLHKGEKGFEMKYMNDDDINHFAHTIIDSHPDFENAGAENAKFLGMQAVRLAPFTGTFMDAKDAYEDFNQGDIAEGFINVGWCVVGFACDFAGGAGTGVRGLKMAMKVGKNVAQNTGQQIMGGVLQTVHFHSHMSESILFSDI